MTLAIPVCEACGTAVFPPRLLCPRCGGREWREQGVEDGVLEQKTEHRGVGIGSVRTSAGPVVVVRVEGDPPEGATVVLDDADGAPTARAR